MTNVQPLRPTVPRGPSPADDDPRKHFEIDVRKQSLPTMATIAWDAIKAANSDNGPEWFTVGSDVIRIVDDPEASVYTERLGMDALGYVSARTAYWHKNTEKDGTVEAFPVERVLRDMLASPEKPLPKLRRITRAPVFGKSGSLSTTPGYNPESQNYFMAGDLKLPPVPLKPTDQQVDDAKAVIFTELLPDFPFVGDAERAHAMSLMLNPFVRDMIDGPTPMYLIEAPAAGTGKGLLAHMLTLPALGTGPVLMPPSNNEEETRKRLTSTLMDIPEAVLIDNVARGLDSPSLAAVLTTQMWHDRLLGRSETKGMPVRCTWIATGNNPSRSNEMSRRLIRIRLDAEAERPEERKGFKHPRLDTWAQENRDALVWSCLTLVQRWIADKKPRGRQNLGSYEAWSAVHGGLLESIGMPGFLGNRRAAEAVASSEDIAWTAFVDAWFEEYGTQKRPISELFPIAEKIPDFPLGRSTTERGQRTAFGMALSNNRDRIFNAKRIKHAGTTKGSAMYQLWETIDPTATQPAMEMVDLE